VNESNDPSAEYLSDGISDSIINRLSQLSNLRVASLSSSLRYKGQAIDAAAVGRDLKVRAVLIGWMTKRGDSLSVRTELVDVQDNRRLWGANLPQSPALRSAAGAGGNLATNFRELAFALQWRRPATTCETRDEEQ
jgi:TolB-like protein